LSKDDDSGSPKVSFKVRIDPALGDECSNLTEIKMEMLENLHRASTRYVHTSYLLDKLIFLKQGIMDQKDCFKCLCIFESLLLGPKKTKSTFASTLGRAVEEIFKLKGLLLTTKTHIANLKKDYCLYDTLLQKGGTDKI
jgi:hypothetical protein